MFRNFNKITFDVCNLPLREHRAVSVGSSDIFQTFSDIKDIRYFSGILQRYGLKLVDICC